MSDNRPRLGKGLEALIPKSFLANGKTIVNIPIDQIVANPFQPRLIFDDEAIKRLSESIKQHGLAQPLMIRRNGAGYELIVGERRLRACRLAGLATVPAIVKDVSDRESLQLALIENLEREDLNSIEEAKGYERLQKEFDMTHNDLAKIFGRSRSSITNTLRLLNLPEHMQDLVANGNLSEGHARTLLGVKNDEQRELLLSRLGQENLNVRELELAVATANNQRKNSKNAAQQMTLFADIEKELAGRWQAPVRIKGTKAKGQIILYYKSQKEFDRISQSLIE